MNPFFRLKLLPYVRAVPDLSDVLRPQGPQRIDLFLSGGGFRAALGALGAIFFLYREGRWNDLRRVVSVSGGGIVNAHLALTRPSEEQVPDEIQAVFHELTSPWRTIRAVGGALLAVAPIVLLLGWAAFTLVPDTGGRFVIACLLVMLAVAPLLRLALHSLYRGMVGNARLGDLMDQDWMVEHVFVATDLSTHGPLFLTTNAIQPQVWSSILGQVDGRDVSVRKAVRASTALPPLLPPTRLRLHKRDADEGERHYLWSPNDWKATQISTWLVDGGVTGNLGIQFDESLASIDMLAFRKNSVSATLAGTSQAGSPYTCPLHPPQIVWDCRDCSNQKLIIDASGMPPGRSTAYELLLGLPIVGSVANAVRSLLVMYESGLAGDQFRAGDSLANVVRVEGVVDRVMRKNWPNSPNADFTSELRESGAYLQNRHNLRSLPLARRAIGFSALLEACILAQADASRLKTNLIAVNVETAAIVVTSGFLNALVTTRGPWAWDEAEAGVVHLSTLLGPLARLDEWWGKVIMSTEGFSRTGSRATDLSQTRPSQT